MAISGISEIERLTNDLIRIVDSLQEMDIYRRNYSTMLFNRGLMLKFNRKWVAYRLALALYAILRKDLQAFISKKQEYASKIMHLDKELGKRIDFFRLPPKGELDVLEPIMKMINQNPQLAISYLITNYQKIMHQLQELNDKKTAHELRRLMVLLSGEEIDELNKCINDIRNWTRYRLANRIDFFTERLMLYVKGGKSDEEEFSGLATHFRDAELAEEMYRIPQIRKLWTYKKEMEFFSWARYVMRKTLELRKGWEEFYEFYNNLRKGKNYIKIVREKFGNPEFADLLERIREKIHESPIDWERELAELQHRLHNPTYQNMYVIQPAANALIHLLEGWINRLSAKKSSAIEELKMFLSNKVKELQNAKLSAQKGFAKIVRSKKNRLLAEWEAMKKEFEFEENSAILNSYKYLEECNNLLASLQISENFERYQGLQAAAMGWINFMKQEQGVSNNEGMDLGILRLRAPVTQLEQIEERKNAVMNEISHPDEVVILNLQRKILEGNEKIKPRFIRFLNYIKSKLENNFVIGIDTLKTLKFDEQLKGEVV